MNATNALNAYKNVGLESGVVAANPHKLILMLYQGALLSIDSAKKQMKLGQIAAKGASISKAIKIIDEGLKACLDVEAGGEIGKNLYSLYDYMNQRLLIANLKNDTAVLDEVSDLLTELKQAWESIVPSQSAPVQKESTGTPKPVVQEKSSHMATPQSTTGKQAVLMYGRM